MNIIIGADIVPTNSNEELFIKGNIQELFGESLCGIIKNADYSIFNLEVPFYNGDTPISKCGPALRADANTINAIKKLDIKLLSLANNHIFDQGEKGLNSTIYTIENAGIDYVGIVDSTYELNKYKLIYLGSYKIGVYSCAEHEFSVATDNSAGAVPFDSYDSSVTLKQLRDICDFIIVLYHGGKEYYRYPSPNLQKNCRLLVNSGADIVICQHSHCIGCEEIYQGKRIIIFALIEWLKGKKITGILVC